MCLHGLKAVLVLCGLTAYGQQVASLPAAEVLIEKERLAEAEQMLELLRAKEASTEVLFRLGYVQFRQRKLQSARDHFAAIVRGAPPAFNSKYFLGRIALLENRPAEAIAWLEPVAASRETIYDAASQLALAYRDAGQPRKALAPLLVAIQQAPWDGGLYYRLGRLYQQLGQAALSREALATSGRLKAAAATDGQVLMQLFQATEKGQTVEAARLGRQIADRLDTDPATLVALGLTWARTGMSAAALEAFEKAALRDATLFSAQFNYGLALLRGGRAAAAMLPLSLASKLLPQSFDANLTLGLAGVMLQRYEEARQPLEAARRLEPSNLRLATLLATAYLRTGKAAEAVKLLRGSGASVGNELTGQLMLVEALNAMSNQEAALEAARKAQQQFPQELSAQMVLAQQLARIGRYQEAGPFFENTLKLEPSHPEALLGLGDVRQKNGNHVAAIESYRLALNYRSTTLAARLGLARSLVATRQLPEARQVLEDGLASHSSEPMLRLELSRVYARMGLVDLAVREAEVVQQLKAAEAKP